MKDLKFLTICPDDTYYTWQVHSWIESLKKLGYSDKVIVLIYIPSFREKNEKWKQVIDLYPEAEFVFYKDDKKDITDKLNIYIPILRPYCAAKYFKEHPEMKEKAIFYCDSDVLFTNKLDIEKFVNDDVNYLSDTNSYINASYFDSKERDVLPSKLEEYKTFDILAQATSLIGINREICERNNLHSGGAQYLLKNIDEEFWEKVIKDCLMIRVYLMGINKQFFESEVKGYQSWCADMWAVLWNLWLREQETQVVDEMNFTWATDPITKLNTTAIFHNAGIVGDTQNGYPAFYKGKYVKGTDPFKDTEHIDNMLNNPETRKHCTFFYLTQLLELKQKYNLNY